MRRHQPQAAPTPMYVGASYTDDGTALEQFSANIVRYFSLKMIEQNVALLTFQGEEDGDAAQVILFARRDGELRAVQL